MTLAKVDISFPPAASEPEYRVAALEIGRPSAPVQHVGPRFGESGDPVTTAESAADHTPQRQAPGPGQLGLFRPQSGYVGRNRTQEDIGSSGLGDRLFLRPWRQDHRPMSNQALDRRASTRGIDDTVAGQPPDGNQAVALIP